LLCKRLIGTISDPTESTDLIDPKRKPISDEAVPAN
jgi:hypothetical protein